MAVWIEFQSRDYLNALEELFSLRHRKAEYQPREGGQKSILVAALQARSSKKVHTDHLHAIPARFVTPEHQCRGLERLLTGKCSAGREN